MPRSSGSAAPYRHTAGPHRTRQDLAVLRPDLVARYDAELPGARAAVLARLLGAVDREPLPGLTVRRPGEATFAVALPSATTTTGGDVVATQSVLSDMETPDGAGAVAAQLRAAVPAPAVVTVRYPAEAARPFAVATVGLAAEVTINAPANARADEHTGIRTSVVADPADLVRLLWADVPLVAEIDNSVANLALARADRPEQRLPAPGGADALGRTEQLVTDGHPLHPCCRTRGGMSVADVLAYAPEHSPVIRLRRLRVPRDRWYGTAAPILFAHPWQAARLVDRYPWLTPDGWSDPVRPLMSLRTVAPVDGGPHIKTAVGVQMTSAVRTVSAAAVHNGPVLSRLLRRLTADQPIEILAEIAAGAVVVDGVPQRHLAHVIREAPQLGPGELAVPLAVLAAVPVPVGDPYAWWERFSGLFFGPVTRVLARGVALEAHGQNTLVVLAGNQPTRILYRDLGGVRVSASRLRASGLEPPALLGDLPSDDPAELRTKLAASAFGTVAAELIAMFTRTLETDPDRLWGIAARAVRATGSEDVPHLLRDPLPVKATTAMRLATDPLDDRWALLPNPMAAHA
ncbi:IucA/IucC family protein [Paractinoplanes hotanensis]|uniref:IucA/IucC family siderophore biosynthesis protein n=1 Tax=Paractinoplanes hotanensis TaxID=2906497 RepID=A0ABT0Y2P8_9ACTN|nr:IucA/IucC family siderophore biosynthesis protein [Actinoplanes hotanensis]MCM4080130.1 IucA/IucC family siderophore biosynthesis protein [Actinoplanes hotanensis]